LGIISPRPFTRVGKLFKDLPDLISRTYGFLRKTLRIRWSRDPDQL